MPIRIIEKKRNQSGFSVEETEIIVFISIYDLYYLLIKNIKNIKSDKEISFRGFNGSKIIIEPENKNINIYKLLTDKEIEKREPILEASRSISVDRTEFERAVLEGAMELIDSHEPRDCGEELGIEDLTEELLNYFARQVVGDDAYQIDTT